MSELTAPNPSDVDWHCVAAWLDTAGLPGLGIDSIQPLTGGTQNLMFRFSRDGRDYILRRPPLHKRAKSDEAMRREIRILNALNDQPVPHPRLVAACPDADVIGAAFYIMEAIEGFNALNGMPPLHRSNAEIRHRMGLHMVDGIAALGAVDVHAVGLADLGNAQNFLQRQPQRWLDELQGYLKLSAYPQIALPDVQPIADWLTRNMPTRSTPGLMHGDFHMGNVMFALNGPELAAIVDWEMCTLGDPLLDLGWMLATWPVLAPHELHPADGFASTDELIARYASRSPRALDDIRWYEVLANYKLGIILEGTYARSRAGMAPQDVGEQLHAMALTLIGNALAHIQNR